MNIIRSTQTLPNIMSSPATVIYFKDEQVKDWLKSKAKANNKSLSNVIAEILTDNYKAKKQNNLMQFAGILNKYPKEIIEQLDESMSQAKKDFNSKPDSFYTDLF
jgi:predicted CopG family antitoxin